MTSEVLQQQDLPAAIGAAFGGGFATDCIRIDGRPHLIITAGKAEGERLNVRWNKNLKRVPGALSYYDSYANTVALAQAGSEVAQWALDLRIGGEKDWCIGARDVIERQYFRKKPTTQTNACWWRDGENPSAIPPAYPYTKQLPAQTTLAAFQKGGAEAFEPVYYWSSTQCEAGSVYAYAQHFSGGLQGSFHKDVEFAVRLVRVIPL